MKASKLTDNSGDPKLDDLAMFFCEDCKQIPLAYMKDINLIKITCKCKDKPFFITLDTFLEKINNSLRDLPICYKKEKHKEVNKATKFCTQCKVFMCNNCFYAHNSTFQIGQKHDIIDSAGMIISTRCENKNCKIEGNTKFFCLKCNVHLCVNCSKDHQHTLIDLDKNTKKVDEVIKENKQMMIDIFKEKKSYCQILNEINVKTQSITPFLENTSKVLKQIDKFCKSFVLPYVKNNKLLNYYVRCNILCNRVKDIKLLLDLKVKQKIALSQKLIRLTPSLEFKDIKNSSAPNLEMTFYIPPDLVKRKINIIGSNYELLSDENCMMFINEMRYPFLKTFNFPSPGEHKVFIQITPNAEITTMKNMFNDCKYMTSIDLSKLNTAMPDNISFLFLNCENLKNVKLDKLNTSNVVKMNSVFKNCKSLVNIDLTSFNTSKVLGMQHMFSDCINLKHANLVSFDTSKVVNFSGMFFNCKNLESLDISNFEGIRANFTKYMFCFCYKLKSLDMSGFYSKNIIDMTSMFSECISLQALNLSEIYTPNTKSFDFMFYKCISLSNLDISNFSSFKPLTYRGMFLLCHHLNYVDFSKCYYKYPCVYNMMFFGCGKTQHLTPKHLLYIGIKDLKPGSFFKISQYFRDYIKSKYQEDYKNCLEDQSTQ